jgi:hypothetical protein
MSCSSTDIFTCFGNADGTLENNIENMEEDNCSSIPDDTASLQDTDKSDYEVPVYKFRSISPVMNQPSTSSPFASESSGSPQEPFAGQSQWCIR